MNATFLPFLLFLSCALQLILDNLLNLGIRPSAEQAAIDEYGGRTADADFPCVVPVFLDRRRLTSGIQACIEG